MGRWDEEAEVAHRGRSTPGAHMEDVCLLILYVILHMLMWTERDVANGFHSDP